MQHMGEKRKGEVDRSHTYNCLHVSQSYPPLPLWISRLSLHLCQCLSVSLPAVQLRAEGQRAVSYHWAVLSPPRTRQVHQFQTPKEWPRP